MQLFNDEMAVERSVTAGARGEMPIQANTLVAKFLENCVFDPETGCWIWRGKASHGRSPVFVAFSRSSSALKMSWELFKGTPPKGAVFRRTCKSPLCVSPHHLTHTLVDKSAGKKPHASPFRKLSEEAVYEIRSSTKSKSFLAKKFDVGEWMIWAVKKGKRGRIAPIRPAEDKQAAKELERQAFINKTIDMLKDLNRC